MKQQLLFIVILLATTLGDNIISAQSEEFTMTPIGNNRFLTTPWDLHYAPDGYLWVTEREPGIVVRVNPTTAERDELIQIPDLYTDAGQDGLLGMALHQDFAGASPYVYLSYSYLLQGERRHKLVRYTYSITDNDGSLSAPVTLIENLPSSHDHNSGRLIFGPDDKLYYTIGDQGNNQSRNYCEPNLAQELPTQTEIDQEDWTNYPGKVLRLNLDGSIPDDNPLLNGVRSHVFSYGHRNAQGIVFGNNGLLYSDEHGPDTDDEVNVIYAGKNYGWPNVAGYQDDQAYDYCNWSSAGNCSSLSYSKDNCPPNAIFLEESDFVADNYQEPLLSMFAVPDDYNFDNPACDNSWICRPNVAPSSIGIYESDAIPGWKNSLLVVSLKRGRIYRLQLNADGSAMQGDTTHHFYTTNRYRDIAVDPDGKSFYIITDASGRTSGPTGLTVSSNLQNPGNILKFTFQGVVNIKEANTTIPFTVYPNPAQRSFIIESDPSISDAYNATLVSAAGQIVRRMTDIHTGIYEENIGNLPTGIYWIHIMTKDKIWQQRVVIQ